jgi:hypothetical protein
MPHPKARMPSLLDVRLRPTEPKDQKLSQPVFRAGEVVFRVNRPEYVVGWNLPVERSD